MPTKIGRATFHRLVRPGETIQYSAKIEQLNEQGASIAGTVTVAGELLGVAKLLTCGGLTIWTLIDFIMIALDKIPDADGQPATVRVAKLHLMKHCVFSTCGGPPE